MADDSKGELRIPVSIGLWALALAASLGSSTYAIQVTQKTTADLAHRLDEHIALGHPVELQRIDQLERGRLDSAAEMRALAGDVRAVAHQLEQANQNIVSLCQATRGAQCTR